MTKLTLNTRVATNLRSIRRARGWTQQELCDKYNRSVTALTEYPEQYGFIKPLTRPTMVAMERGTRPIKVDEMDMLASILGVPLNVLVGRYTWVMAENSEYRVAIPDDIWEALEEEFCMSPNMDD